MDIMKIRAAIAAACTFLALSLDARVISYAPLSDQHALPAIQHRMNREFVLIESSTMAPPATIPGYYGSRRGQLVLYDSVGEREPRVIFPSSGEEVLITDAAAREDSNGQLSIFVAFRRPGEQALSYSLSLDSGASWKAVTVPGSGLPQAEVLDDVGGPIIRNRGAQIRIGTSESPFVFATAGRSLICAVDRNGTVRELTRDTGGGSQRLTGSNKEGTEFLVVGINAEQYKVDLTGKKTPVGPEGNPGPTAILEGWITSEGDVYTHELRARNLVVAFYQGRKESGVASRLITDFSQRLNLFAAPVHDYNGAWIVQRGIGTPTILSLHTPSGGLVEQWRDISAPEVEAIHSANSGRRVLVQVHRPRPQFDQRIFRDPALAIWEMGQPAPQRYDELFLIEGPTKGFVHLDVDAVARGEGFVFDSAATTSCEQCGGGGQISGGGGGGADVTQEWGVVRASLQQRLVIPGVSRVPGAYNSTWRTDIVVQNTWDEPLDVGLRFVPRVGTGSPTTVSLKLAPRELRHIPDVVLSTFNLENAGGALYIMPPLGRDVVATSRTYTVSPAGTFGMGVNAIDVYAAASSRFPVSFAGAFLGIDYRTNVIATNAEPRPTQVSLEVHGISGKIGRDDVTLAVDQQSESQMNSASLSLSIAPWETGSLIFRPKTGQAIPSVVVIDNRTNDPTYFPPDLPANVVRTIPVIGHVDGANNSRFRSDLYLYNPSGQTRSVMLTAKSFDVQEQEQALTFTLLPYESKIIPDVYLKAFGKTGLGRLRFVSGSMMETSSIRVTSRTYNIDAKGGTYGFVMPPLNPFQAVGSGESLEILGAVGGANFRTNVGLVDLNGWPTGQQPHRVKIEIFNETGKEVDSFETQVPQTGGIQLLDIFRARGLGHGPKAALIRISPSSGLIGTFATLIDNGTNDATLLTAALAAK